MNPTDRIPVTLDAQTWETVLRVIAQAPVPYAVVAPLIASIQQQCVSTSTPARPAENGPGASPAPIPAPERANCQAPAEAAAPA